MTDITIPVITADLDKQELARFAEEYRSLSEEIVRIEKMVVPLLTEGNRSQCQPLISFGHDVLQTLFDFPYQARKVNAYFKRNLDATEGDTVFLERNEVKMIFRILNQYKAASNTPRVVTTSRGTTYQESWNKPNNIPCLVRKIQENAEVSLSSDQLDKIAEIAAANDAFYEKSRSLVLAWTPHFKIVCKKFDDWTKTEEGIKYVEARLSALQNPTV